MPVNARQTGSLVCILVAFTVSTSWATTPSWLALRRCNCFMVQSSCSDGIRPPGVAVLRFRVTKVDLEWASTATSPPSSTASTTIPYKIATSDADPQVISKSIVRVISKNGEATLVSGPESRILEGTVPVSAPDITIAVSTWLSPTQGAKAIHLLFQHKLPPSGDVGLLNLTSVSTESYLNFAMPIATSDFLAAEVENTVQAQRRVERGIVVRAADNTTSVRDTTFDLLDTPGSNSKLTLFGRAASTQLRDVSVMSIDTIRMLKGATVTWTNGRPTIITHLR